MQKKSRLKKKAVARNSRLQLNQKKFIKKLVLVVTVISIKVE